MRTKFLPLLLVAGMTFGGAAFAGTTTTTMAPAKTTMSTTTTKVAMTPGTTAGTIKSISAKGDYVVLSDGWKYHVTPTFSLKEFKVGQKVSVSYTLKGKKHEVTSMSAA